MTKNEIAIALRNCRKKMKLTGPVVVQKLHDMGIDLTVKALYNWETARCQPDFQAFMGLCDIYGLDNVMQEFGYGQGREPGMICGALKQELLDKIMLLDEDDCKIVSAYVDGLLTGNTEKAV